MSDLTSTTDDAPRGAHDLQIRFERLRHVAATRPRSATAVVAIWIVAAAIALSSVTGVGPLFWADSINHLWVVSAIDDSGVLPPLTISGTKTGQLYPALAFYGGTLYWVTNLVGRLLGSFELAYDLTILASFGASFLGAFWLARQLRARMVLASLAGLALIACPYFLTNVLGRGAWPEFVATSWIPLLIASFASTTRRPTGWSVTLVVVSMSVVSGSHVITLVYGVAFLVAVLVTIAIVDRSWFRQTTGLLFAGAAAGLGMAMNAWWIAPLVRYSSSTVIGSQGYFAFGMEFTQLRFVLSPFLAVPGSSTTPHLHANAPVWVLVATLVGIVVTVWTGQLRMRIAVVLMVGLAGLIVLGSFDGIWHHLPATLRVIQFPYRTLTYTHLWVVGMWIVVASALGRAGRRASRDTTSIVSVVLILGVTVQVLLSMVQISDSHRDALEFDRALATADATPSTFYSWADYRFTPGPTSFSRSIDMAGKCSGGRCVVSGLKTGEPTQVSVPETPFVKVSPSTSFVGRSKDGLIVVAAGPDRTVTIERTRPPVAVLGLFLSFVAIGGAIWLVIRAALRSRRPRAPHPLT